MKKKKKKSFEIFWNKNAYCSYWGNAFYYTIFFTCANVLITTEIGMYYKSFNKKRFYFAIKPKLIKSAYFNSLIK